MALLHPRFEIAFEQPLPEYDGAYAKAYRVQVKTTRNTGLPAVSYAATPLMALVCEGLLPIRIDGMAMLRSMPESGIIPVLDSGVIVDPATGKRHYAFIYPIPFKKRLAPLGEAMPFSPLKETVVIDALVKPLGHALMQLEKTRLFHGSIRASNVFYNPGEPALLGDALAAPLAWGQPVVYETLERGMASPMARGEGNAAVDFYAFGMVLVAALKGETPLRGLADAAILDLKAARGSYLAAVGEKRFGNGLAELLRGLLADDEAQRWGSKEFDMWLLGRRLTPRQALPLKRATRPLHFGGEDFVELRPLMAAFAKDIKNAAALIHSHDFERWIANAINNPEVLTLLKDSITAAKRMRLGHEEDRLITSVMLAMDTKAPIRYRGVVVFPQGIGGLLAELVLHGKSPALLREIITNGFSRYWGFYQSKKSPDRVLHDQLLEHAAAAIENQALGQGLERALYELNPFLPCLSPHLRDAYGCDSRDVLEAMDKQARKGTLTQAQLMDRHIAAFLLLRDKKTLASAIRAIEQASSPMPHCVALLNLYADLQYRHGSIALPGLAAVLLPAAEESAKRFHLRRRQEKARNALKQAAASGNLVTMLNLVDNPDSLEEDAREFAAAQQQHQQMHAEISGLQKQLQDKKTLARVAGEPVAAVCALGIAFVLWVLLALGTLLGVGL